MPQTRPRLDDDLAAKIREYAASFPISFNAAVTILLRRGLDTVNGDSTDENNS